MTIFWKIKAQRWLIHFRPSGARSTCLIMEIYGVKSQISFIGLALLIFPKWPQKRPKNGHFSEFFTHSCFLKKPFQKVNTYYNLDNIEEVGDMRVSCYYISYFMICIYKVSLYQDWATWSISGIKVNSPPHPYTF